MTTRQGGPTEFEDEASQAMAVWQLCVVEPKKDQDALSLFSLPWICPWILEGNH